MIKRNIVILLVMVIIFLSVAYAAFSQQLDITGIASISAEWKIEFTDIEEINSSYANNVSMTAVGTLATFEVDLLAPGAYMEYEVEVSNNGTIDAQLAEITTSFSEPETPEEIQFFLSGVEVGSELNAGESTNFLLRIEWIGGMPLEITKQFQVAFLYAQNTGIFESERKPVITLLGDNLVELKVGEAYNEQGATAVDSYDEDISEDVVVTSDLNVNEAGIYMIKYNVTDEYGKNADEVIRVVYVLAGEIVGHWKLNGNATDSSSNNNHGTNYGATATSDRNDNLNRALHFDGDSYVRSEHIDDYNVEDSLTIAAWIKRSDGQLYSWACMVNRNRDQGINLQHNQTNTAFQFAVRTDTGRTHIDATPTGGIQDNVWYHLAGVYNGSNIIFYINGVEAGTAPRTGDVYLSTTPFLIGAWGHASVADRFFYGDIDDVRFYNVALSGQEIVDIYEEGMPTNYEVTYVRNPTVAGELEKYSELVDQGSIVAGNDYTSNEGYTFVNYTIVDGSCVGVFDSSTGECTAVVGDMTIQANWIASNYTVTYLVAGEGVIEPEFRTVTHRFSAAAPTVTPNLEYELLDFSIVTGDCGGNFNLTTGFCSSVTENITIQANMAILYFSDNFNREEIGDDWIIESGDITIEDNYLKLRADDNSERSWLTLNKSFIEGDIEFDWYSDHNANVGSDMRFKFLATGDLITTASWSQEGYQVQWETWNAGSPMRLYRLNGSSSTLLGGFFLSLEDGRNTWHNMRIEITDTEIKLYHNDDLKITSTDTTYRGEGDFIFGGREGINRTVRYDNFSIGE